MLRNIVEKEFAAGKRPEIRDYMLDMHTKRGQELNRDLRYFLDVASVVEPLVEGSHDEYLPRLRRLIDDELA